MQRHEEVCRVLGYYIKNLVSTYYPVEVQGNMGCCSEALMRVVQIGGPYQSPTPVMGRKRLD